MIGGVELQFLDHVADIRRLDHHDARGFENGGKSCDEAAQIGNMGQHIVGVDHVGELAVGAQSRGEVGRKEFADRFDATLARYLGDVAGRFDAENRNAGVAIILQQVAVIAGDLDHAASGTERAVLDQPLGQ